MSNEGIARRGLCLVCQHLGLLAPQVGSLALRIDRFQENDAAGDENDNCDTCSPEHAAQPAIPADEALRVYDSPDQTVRRRG